MRNQFITGLLAVTTLAALTGLPARALTPERFAATSKLSTGKWVKISVDNDGVYQLTAEQLSEMGFDDPSRVRIYGQGGHAISELLDNSQYDDLVAVPSLYSNGKVLFYGQGTVGREMAVENNATLIYYYRTRNAYANRGSYFITEDDSPADIPAGTSAGSGSNLLTSSYDLFLHESELQSFGSTGKQLFGESLLPDGFTLDYRLPQRCDKTITVRVGAAVFNATQASYITARVLSGGTETSVGYTTTEAKVSMVSTNYDPQRHYNFRYPTRSVTLNDTEESGQLSVSMFTQSATTFKLANLDYAAITYKRHNRYDGSQPYFRMGYPSLGADDCVTLPDAGGETVVWDVTDPQDIRQMQLAAVTGEDGQTAGLGFTPGVRATPSEFVVFRTDGEFPTISGFSPVENQNLHGLETPDMLIVTNAYFMPEAERLAQIHRDHDGMIVHVVDQEQVFNEFSSGTPDAMAVRLLCKMLYDRDRAAMTYRFKHLLMFGPASFDYRGLTTDKPNRVITYESDESDSDEYSYGTDDFFAIIDDGSGDYLVADKLRLGVGRLTPTDLAQAAQNVDKIAHYILNPDYGSWRNHYTVWADTGNEDLHALQAEGIDNKIQETLKIPMVGGKAYVDMFPLDGDIATAARQHVVEMLNAGQYYGTYIGHANTKSFTSKRMWNNVNVRTYTYDRQPIFMTACCDVARYDSNAQGIAELMFHQPNGGAIALLTSSREVEATQNDILNQAFTEAMFNYVSTGEMTTLGQAYMRAKQSQRAMLSVNKMSYLLLGDPAIKVEYPKPLFHITQVNGLSPESDSIVLSPLQRVAVTAEVRNSDGTLDTSFTGDATLSVYDARQLFKHGKFVSMLTQLESDIYYPRDLLVEVQGRVENGRFSGQAVLPRYIKAQPGETLAIHVYAHKDNSSEMVNGVTRNVSAGDFDQSQAITDDAAPVIDAMYLNEAETFALGASVAPNSTLHISASDDMSFSAQGAGVGSTMKLTLDGGPTHYTLVKQYARISDGGRRLQVDFPVTGLSAGRHSLTFWVQDACGNATERTITFMVGESGTLSLKTGDLVAVDEAVIDLDDTPGGTMPTVTLKVVDAAGRLVWHDTASSLPFCWDLRGDDGRRVAPGLYKLFGQYDDGVSFGGTNICPIIVMDSVKRTTASN